MEGGEGLRGCEGRWGEIRKEMKTMGWIRDMEGWGRTMKWERERVERKEKGWLWKKGLDSGLRR